MTQDSENSGACPGATGVAYLRGEARPENIHTAPDSNSARTRAAATRGRSYPAVYREVCRALRESRPTVGTLVDLGCGSGNLWRQASALFSTYIGIDLIRYDDFPSGVTLVVANLNTNFVPLQSECADIVAAINIIEYLENPRAIICELTRLAKPSGIIILSTKNHLSVLSKLNLLLRNRFVAFKKRGPECDVPEITALFEFDLIRMARECNLTSLQIRYTNDGRIPFSSSRWPSSLGFRGQHFSDDLVLIARKSAGPKQMRDPAE